MSLQLVLAGLYPPFGTDFEWSSSLNWQPISTSYIGMREDDLILSTKPCARFNLLFNEVIKNEFAQEIAANSKFYEQFKEFTGIKFVTPLDIISVYGTLKSQASIENYIFNQNFKEFFGF